MERARRETRSIASVLVVLGCVAWSWGCFVDSSIDRRDGWPDAPPADSVEGDTPADEGPSVDCGNGSREGDEECDDGDLNSDTEPDACRTDCTLPSCGDDVRDTGEQCDDGDLDDNDSCTNDCTVARCGDGSIYEGVEQCDDGNEINTDACLESCRVASCGDGFIHEGVEECDNGEANDDTLRDACRENCSNPSCGDGVTDSGEGCDDGNTIDDDECSNTCRRPGCGDGETVGDEECDDGNYDNTDDCLNTCVAASCGDGFVWAGVETCDDGNLLDTDACLATCEEAECGDGFVWAGTEECDDAELNSDTEPDACRTDCTDHRCGDGVTDTGEVCDDGNTIDDDECNNSCATGDCGNGTTDTGEECDDGNSDNTDDCLSSCLDASCGDGFVWVGTEECDGDAPRACDTSCGTTGEETCEGCSWSECKPPDEACNGIDDDCDTLEDEDFACVQGTTTTCTSSCGTTGSIVCTSTCTTTGTCSPPAETCNGIDDDCDTVADDGFDCEMDATTECVTTCGSYGEGTCSSACELPEAADCTPPDEICNGIDDDCDGSPDNGFQCVQGTITACTTTCGSTGTAACSATCHDPTPTDCVPPLEICNGVDDDCDTLTDESGEPAVIAGPLMVSDEDGERSENPAVVSTGTDFGIVWEDAQDAAREIYFAVVSPDGSTSTAATQATDTGTDSTNPSATWNGGDIGISFTDAEGGTYTGIHFIEADPGGGPPIPIVTVDTGSGADYDRPALRPRGSGYAVAWDSGDHILFARLNGVGHRTGASTTVESDPALSRFTDAAFDGTVNALVWEETRDGNPEIYAAIVEDDGTIGVPPFRITYDVNDSLQPCLSWNGTEFAVAWSDTRGGASNIFFATFDDTGSATPPVPVTSTGGSSTEPDLVWTGDGYGLAWADESSGDPRVNFVLLDPTGTPVGTALEVSAASASPIDLEIAWNGSEFGVVWHAETGTADTEVWFAVISLTSC